MILNRLLTPFIGLIFGLRALWSILRGSENLSDLRERLTGPNVKGPAIWVHGASVGEMNAARPIIAALAADRIVIVTVTTTTGRATVRNWDLPSVHAALAPLDWRWVTRGMLRRNQITGLVIIENELWPNRIAACHGSSVPVIMINARMSASSARSWGRFKGLATAVLGPMRLVAPQDNDSAKRLQSLGVPAAVITPPMNLKGQYAPNLSAIPAHLQAFDRKSTFLAAATHEGEETIALDAFAIMRKTRPDLQLIIAPRHPVRGQAVAAEIAASGLSVAFHSSDDATEADVYLADTLGDMHIWYRLSGAALIGGSLVPKGGHTPFEPAAYDCPIISGPHVTNFTDAYATLLDHQAAITVTDAQTLATAALQHMNDDAIATRAKIALDQPDIAPLILKVKSALGPNA